MKILIKIFTLVILCVTGMVCHADMREIVVEKNIVNSADFIEKFLRENTINSDIMVLTHVPRGLIVSIDEGYFFNKNSTKIKASAIPILNDMIFVLQNTDNRCVIEGHTENNTFHNKQYEYDWELSLLRAGNIVKFLIACGKISPKRLFTLGFGEYMPSIDNVDENLSMNNRIDFVFIDYRSKTR